MTGNDGRILLQPRDHQFLSILGQMRLVDREMAQLLLRIPSARNTNKRLLELTRNGLLGRFFVGTTGAGRKAIYTLSPKGAALANAEYRGIKRRPEENLVGDLFVQHQLEVNSICVTVRHRPVPLPGIRARRWLTFHEPPVNPSQLIPDAYFEMESPSGIRALFLEVDRGTEALRIWERKINEYLRLAVSGDFTRCFHQPQFRVLIVTTSERRLWNMRELIRKKTDKIFWLSTFERIRGPQFWASVWLRSTGNQDHSLF